MATAQPRQVPCTARARTRSAAPGPSGTTAGALFESWTSEDDVLAWFRHEAPEPVAEATGWGLR